MINTIKTFFARHTLQWWLVAIIMLAALAPMFVSLVIAFLPKFGA